MVQWQTAIYDWSSSSTVVEGSEGKRSGVFIRKRARTELRNNSFRLRVGRSWNELPDSVCNISSTTKLDYAKRLLIICSFTRLCVNAREKKKPSFQDPGLKIKSPNPIQYIRWPTNALQNEGNTEHDLKDQF